MKMLLIGIVLLTAACVSVSSPLSVGDNAYLISVVSHAQWKEAIESGVNQANRFCASKGLRATVTNTSTAGTDFMSSSKAQVWFSCTR
jgi:hypothetical protein